MSATPPTDPKGADKDYSNALIWAVLAGAFAVGMFVYAGKVEPEKRNLYFLMGAIGAIVAAVNGYGAWTAYNKSKTPPKA